MYSEPTNKLFIDFGIKNDPVDDQQIGRFILFIRVRTRIQIRSDLFARIRIRWNMDRIRITAKDRCPAIRLKTQLCPQEQKTFQ
jgi:hypothetical protein